MNSETAAAKTILVTGITGYIAGHVTNAFLEKGYRVRGTTRSSHGIEAVKQRHREHIDKLEFVVVPDMAAPHAFHKAARGVSGIIHIASPLPTGTGDNEEGLLLPTKQSMLNILEAAKGQQATLERVVLTGSFICVGDMSQVKVGYTYTDEDWNPITYEEAKSTTNGALAYFAAKKFGELAAWEWMQKENPPFSFTSIHSPWVLGPVLGGVEDLNQINATTGMIWNLINGSLEKIPEDYIFGFTDVRDIALIHLRAFEVEEAGNERFLVGSYFDYQAAVDILNTHFPDLQDKIPKGTPGNKSPSYNLSTRKAQSLLAIEYTSLAKTLQDTVSGLLQAQNP
jgi:nucleoside-diphosphate-sugar epimerase